MKTDSIFINNIIIARYNNSCYRLVTARQLLLTAVLSIDYVIIMGNNQKRVYPVRLESKTGTGWNQVKNTLDEPRDWSKTNRTRFSEIMTRVHL